MSGERTIEYRGSNDEGGYVAQITVPDPADDTLEQARASVECYTHHAHQCRLQMALEPRRSVRDLLRIEAEWLDSQADWYRRRENRLRGPL